MILATAPLYLGWKKNSAEWAKRAKSKAMPYFLLPEGVQRYVLR